MENITLKRIFTIGITIGLILFSIPIVIYGIKFGFDWKNISDNTSDWGAFSDFVGGIINPFFSIINILILIYLTFKVANWDKTRDENTFKRENKLRQYEIMLSAFKEFNILYYKVKQTFYTSYQNGSTFEFSLLSMELISLVNINKIHFSYLTISENYQSILDDIQKVEQNYNELKKQNKLPIDDKVINKNIEELKENLKCLLNNYNNFLEGLRLELNTKFDEMKN